MSKDPLISVIVPVYHVEKYLTKCVDSICSQTYDNLEIILVDDGGDDMCPSICDEYKKIDSRIKVIHKKNGGLSDARNAGLDIATGQYLYFVDSDDYIDDHTIEFLYASIVANGSDIAVCEYVRVSEDGEKIHEKHVSGDVCCVYSRDEMFHLYESDELSWLIGVAWNKLYKKSVFDTIRYPVGKIHEDDFVSHRIYSVVDKVTFVFKPLYFYLQRDSSIMGESFSIKRIDGAEAQLDRILFAMDTERYFLINKSHRILLSILWSAMQNVDLSNDSSREKLSSIVELYKQEYPKFKEYCQLSFRENVKRYLLFNHQMRLNRYFDRKGKNEL